MKFLERLVQLRTQLSDKYAAMYVRKLEELSEAPEGRGWFFDPWGQPGLLYILGIQLKLMPTIFSLGWLEEEYNALKTELQARFPEFEVKTPIRLNLEVSAASAVLSDLSLLKSLETGFDCDRSLAKLVTHDCRVSWLQTTVTFGGDKVTLRVVRECEYKNYDFFVTGHPDAVAPETGKICRPSLDALARVSGSDTR